MPLARRNHIQTSFNAGELSPRLHARTDFERYAAGMKECTNFIPLVQGGIKRRSGTRFIREVKDSAKQTTLIPFQFSDVQAYILEVGDTYIRFYKSQGIIVAADLRHGPDQLDCPGCWYRRFNMELGKRRAASVSRWWGR